MDILIMDIANIPMRNLLTFHPSGECKTELSTKRRKPYMIEVMKFKKPLTVLTFGTVALLSFGFTACSQTTGTQSTSSESSTQEVAQSPMSGMDHGTGMPADGTGHGAMNHGAMNLGPKDETFDLRFIDAMIPHHEGAVIMAQEALQKSSRPEIQQLAQAIISAQEQEIQQLQEWRLAWYPDAGDAPLMYHAEMGHTMPMTDDVRSSMMMSGDLGAADDQFDLRFINAMIPHHEGAIAMAQQVLQNSDRPEVKELAQNIIDSQQQEIDQMIQWRQAWYAQ